MHRGNAGVASFDCFGRRPDFVRFALVVERVRDENDSLCPVLARVDGFVYKRCMRGEVFTVPLAVGIQLLRLVTKHHDDVALHINSLVIIPLELGRRDAVAGKHKRSIDAIGIGESDRNEIFLVFQRCLIDFKTISFSKFCAGGDFKCLKVGLVVTGRLQSCSAELRRDVVCGFFQFR